ncbi:MAG: hypothetical protein LBI10_01390, partial [Deltaproteobacteria bacterium]|nr:hypothetical protein [Deltaproteobacteria bacterium]
MLYVNSSKSIFKRQYLNHVQRRDIDKTWAPSFQREVLEHLSMDKIEDLYCQDNGRPTQDLRAVTGDIILQLRVIYPTLKPVRDTS